MRIPLLVCTLACLAAAQQAEQPTGSISGRVLAGHGGPPVRGAAVTVTRTYEELGLAWSGQDGRYTIEGVPPGRYVLIATKPALGGPYGRPVDVRAGETTRNADIPMRVPSVLAGRVADADDLPIEGARVSLQTLTQTHGRPAVSRAFVEETNDRGEFRIRVEAARRHFLVLQPPSKPGVAGAYQLLHPPLFYPNAVNPAEAQPVRTEPGVKIETIDFEIPPPADTAMVIFARTGVPGEQPRACMRCRFSLQARHVEAWLEVLSGESNSQGRIEIRGVPPGSYRIAIVESSARDLYAGYERINAEKGQLRTHEVTAWAANSIPIQLTLVDPPEELRAETGEWTAGIQPEALDPLYPGLRRMNAAQIQARGLSGHSRLPLPPGEWALRLYKGAPLREKAYIEEVLWGGRPQRGPFVAVNQLGHSARIEVRVGFASAILSGKVSGLTADEPMNPLVHIIPEPADGYGTDSIAIVGAGGEFESEDLRPGSYLLYAVSAPARDLDFDDPTVRAEYANYAKRVTLEPNGKLRVDLKAIP